MNRLALNHDAGLGEANVRMLNRGSRQLISFLQADLQHVGTKRLARIQLFQIVTATANTEVIGADITQYSGQDHAHASITGIHRSFIRQIQW